jgi:HD superfamily phosphodiesterase
MDFGIDFTLFKLKPDYFDHQSNIHGINHTFRVMYHVLQIASKRGLKREGTTAFCAAYIHDLARLDDGYCTQHGEWASERKLPSYKKLFHKIGLKEIDILKIETAVTNHSLPEELKDENSAYVVTALLKDADALDRIRLGEGNLDIRYLRFPESKNMVESAKDIFFATDKKGFRSFAEILKFINEL